jgi:hypothetical protein
MNTDILQRHFAAIGARLKIEAPYLGDPRIDVLADSRGEHFAISFIGGTPRELEVVDLDRPGKHLLLLARGEEKSKFLCGHDERHWFVAAVPEDVRGVTGVATAKAALQPALVQWSISRTRPKDRFTRRNAAYVRQGEWFFVPAPWIDPPGTQVIHNEALTRGLGKAHIIEKVFRAADELVYVSTGYERGLTEDEFDSLHRAVRTQRQWTQMMREPDVYASGAIRRPDHATVRLNGWHRVVMNTEQSARAMQHVVFLD